MYSTIVPTSIKVADEVFIATALLHRENPARREFSVNEIVARAARENLGGVLRPGIRVHAHLHCVANLAPNPGKYRMLFATGRSTRRLLLPGDEVHPARTGKQWPERDEVPARYGELIDWARKRYEAARKSGERTLPGILQLHGLGREIWEGEDPDEYVRNLREGWG